LEDLQPALTGMDGMLNDTLPPLWIRRRSRSKRRNPLRCHWRAPSNPWQSFQSLIGNIPLLSTFLPEAGQKYAPETPLADSLKNLSDDMNDLPLTLKGLSTSVNKADV
jgi:hypothetical protein